MLKIEKSSISRPFIIYSDTDISGTAGGNPSVESYCSLDYTSASRYRLKREDHNQIFQFFGNILGSQNKPVYCLDKFADGPYNDVPYESRSFETLFPAATERQKEMLGWILANTYPAVSGAVTFREAGVNASASPVLDDIDAYAAVQVALWVLLGQISLDEVYFLDCAAAEDHPKSDRLRQTVIALLRAAGQYADAGQDSQSLRHCPDTGCSLENDWIKCCNKSVLPKDASAPQLIFSSCPDEVRTMCGRLLIGPFRIQSDFNGQPQINVTPFCDCSGEYSYSFMDFCGNPIPDPVIGQEFYIALRMKGRFICFTLTASFTGNITRVITMEAQSTVLNYQPIGTSFDDEEVTLTAEMCICAGYPSGTESGCKDGWSGININNNNNINTNNNMNANTNTNTNGLTGFIMPYPCMPCWPPNGGYPPEPPRPPYPPEPPWPPEPPRPPYPPKPECPPCPPEPPRPSKPECPPCPPKPPCLPEPPCIPKPPCPPKPECGCKECRPNR